MKKYIIDFDCSSKMKLNSPAEIGQENFMPTSKGWSLSYVYNFNEIRDVYLAIKEFKYTNINAFTKHCKKANLPYSKTPWNERRLLEHINALINFGLINTKGEIIQNVFLKSVIGDRISVTDLFTFRKIYFSYFRFKEIFGWLLKLPSLGADNKMIDISENTLLYESFPIFTFASKGKYSDSFFYEMQDCTNLYVIDEAKGGGLSRFWDVFVSWGLSLNVLEKFNLKSLGYKTSFDTSFTCTYVINPSYPAINIVEYIKINYSNNYVYVPDVVVRIAINFRLSIKSVHEIILEQYKIHKEYISFERTSEIFVKKSGVKEGDKVLFLFYRDSFISHIIIRK